LFKKYSFVRRKITREVIGGKCLLNRQRRWKAIPDE
jgi:PilZ domain